MIRFIQFVICGILISQLTSCAVNSSRFICTESNLQYRTLEKGVGPQAVVGDQVLIEESTRYPSGKLIFSTDQIGQPLRVTLGANQVISGVEEGLIGMNAGEIRQLIVPPALSKRSQYPDSIHPDSTLHYRIKLLEIL